MLETSDYEVDLNAMPKHIAGLTRTLLAMRKGLEAQMKTAEALASGIIAAYAKSPSTEGQE